MKKLLVLVGFCGCDLDSTLPDNGGDADAPFDIDAAIDAPVDGTPDAAAVTCAGLTAGGTTRGMWCFDEGTGTTTSNRAGCGDDISGVAPADWQVGGGVRPTTSTMRIPDSTCLDLAPPWRVDISVELDRVSGVGQALLWRADYAVGAGAPYQWLRMTVGLGNVYCEVGMNDSTAFNVGSAPGALTTGQSILSCVRATDGTLTVLIGGVDRSDVRQGTTHGQTVGTNVDFTVGYTDAPTTIQPDAPHRVDGVIKAIAIHAE